MTSRPQARGASGLGFRARGTASTPRLEAWLLEALKAQGLDTTPLERRPQLSLGIDPRSERSLLAEGKRSRPLEIQHAA